MSDTPEEIKRRERAERLYKGNDFVKGLIARLEMTKQECAKRYMEVHHPQMVPIHHFTEASTECILLYVEGYFVSTVMVTQAVAEGISRFVAECNGIEFDRKKTIGLKILCLLVENTIISEQYKDAFKRLWERRNDVHHMNPEVAKIRFPELARKSIQDFVAIEQEIFAGSWSNDFGFIPTNPKYWGTQADGKTGAFLRISP